MAGVQCQGPIGAGGCGQEGCGQHVSLRSGGPPPSQSHLAAGGLSCLLRCKISTIEKAPLSVEASLSRSASSAQPGLCQEVSQHHEGERSQGQGSGIDR